jgi:hypothetical protein
MNLLQSACSLHKRQSFSCSSSKELGSISFFEDIIVNHGYLTEKHKRKN